MRKLLEITQDTLGHLNDSKLESLIRDVIKEIPRHMDLGISTSNPAILYVDDAGKYFYKRNMQHSDVHVFYPLDRNCKLYFIKFRPCALQPNVINSENMCCHLNEVRDEIEKFAPDDDCMYLVYSYNDRGYRGCVVNEQNRIVFTNCSKKATDGASYQIAHCAYPDYELKNIETIYFKKDSLY